MEGAAEPCPISFEAKRVLSLGRRTVPMCAAIHTRARSGTILGVF
jgi:hypothetical protein